VNSILIAYNSQICETQLNLKYKTMSKYKTSKKDLNSALRKTDVGGSLFSVDTVVILLVVIAYFFWKFIGN